MGADRSMASRKRKLPRETIGCTDGGAQSETVRALRFIGSTLQAALMGVWTLLWILIALTFFALTRDRRLPLLLARSVWAPVILGTLGVRLEVSGIGHCELPQPCLFVANHESVVDIPVLFRALPVPLRFLAKAELRRVPLVGLFISAMGMVFIDRGDADAARESVEQVAQVLSSGACVVAFPEGTRSRRGEIRRFKTGAFVAAIKASVPVVPIKIEGTAAILPPDGFAPRTGSVRVVVGTPISSSGLGLEDRGELASRVRLELVALRS